MNGSRTCVVLCECSSNPLMIKIFSAKADAEALPTQLVQSYLSESSVC